MPERTMVGKTYRLWSIKFTDVGGNWSESKIASVLVPIMDKKYIIHPKIWRINQPLVNISTPPVPQNALQQ